MATPLNYLAEEVLLQEIFKVDQVECYQELYSMDTRYILVKDKKVVCNMKFDVFTPIEDRVTAIRVAMRIEHGNDSEGEGSSPS